MEEQIKSKQRVADHGDVLSCIANLLSDEVSDE